MLKPLFGIPLLDNIVGAMSGGHGPSYGGGISSEYGAPSGGYGAPDAGICCNISLFKTQYWFSSLGYGAPDAGYGAPDAGYGAPDAGKRPYFQLVIYRRLLKATALRRQVTEPQLGTLASTPAAATPVLTEATPLPRLATLGAGGRSV